MNSGTVASKLSDPWRCVIKAWTEECTHPKILEDERAEGQAKSGAGGLVLVDLLPGSSIGSHSGCRSALCGKAGEVSSCHGDVKGHVLVVKQAVDKEVRLAAVMAVVQVRSINK